MKKHSVGKKQIEWMKEELLYLKEHDLLSAPTVENIISFYREEESKKRESNPGGYLFVTLTSLGVLMFGFSLFLLLSFNWAYLSPCIKTGILFLGMAVTAVAGIVCRVKRRELLSSLFLLGEVIVFGAVIWQVTQIFNICMHYPSGILFWALGAFLLALLSQMPILHYFTAFLLVLWTGYEILGYQHIGPGIFRDLYPNFPNAAWVLPLFVWFGFQWGWKRSRSSVCNAYLLVFAWWLILQNVVWDVDWYWPYTVAATGGILTLMGFLFARGVPNSEGYTPGQPRSCGFVPPLFLKRQLIPNPELRLDVAKLCWGLGLLLVFASLSFASFYDWNANYIHDKTSFLSLGKKQWPFIFWCFLFLFYLFLYYRTSFFFMRGRNAKTRLDLSVLISPTFMGFFALLLLEIQIPLIMTVCVNVMLLVMVWWMLLRGMRLNRFYFWLGVVYFLGWSIMRYFDLFGNAGGMLGASLFFLALGVLLFGIAWFWTKYSKTFESYNREQYIKNIQIPITMYHGNESGEKSDSTDENTTNLVPLIGVILLHFCLPSAMIGNQIFPFIQAERATVETRPIDPRDVFCGDYVILNYEFSSTGGVRWEKGNAIHLFDQEFADGEDISGRTVYLILIQDAEKGIWYPRTMTLKKPMVGIYLKGIAISRYQVRYGIESFYVQEGRGKDIEAAIRGQNNQRVLVDILIARDGRARIQGVRIVPAKPALTNNANPPNQRHRNTPVKKPTEENPPQGK